MTSADGGKQLMRLLKPLLLVVPHLISGGKEFTDQLHSLCVNPYDILHGATPPEVNSLSGWVMLETTLAVYLLMLSSDRIEFKRSLPYGNLEHTVGELYLHIL
jgi:hypothetical protein